MQRSRNRAWRAALCTIGCVGLTVHSGNIGATGQAGGEAAETHVLRLRRSDVLSDFPPSEPSIGALRGNAPYAGPGANALGLRLATGLSTPPEQMQAVLGTFAKSEAAIPDRAIAQGLRPRRGGAPMLFAQNAASETRTDAPLGDGGSSGADPVAGDASAARFFSGWGIPPIRWGGQLITDLRADKSTDQPARLQHVEIATVKGASYIWQPWFSRINGGVSLVTNKEYRKDTPGQPADPAQNARSKALSGNVDLTLFPVSRFPTRAFFDLTDSRTSGEARTSDTSNTRVGLTQSYRPVEGQDNYSGSFNRSTLESPAAGKDTVNALAANAHNVRGAQTYDLAGSYTTNSRSNTGENTALSNISVRHNYREESDISVDSFASLNNSAFHLLSSGVPSDSRSRFLQGNTFATWRPDEDSPLFVSGGTRIFRSTINSTGARAESATLSGNLAATYALSRQTNLTGSAAVTQLRSDGAGSVLTTQVAGINHSGNPAAVAGFDYNWNAGATGGNQTGLVEGSRQNLGGQAGHNLTRGLSLSESSLLTFSVGQNLGTQFNTQTGSAQTLGHNGSVTWRVSRDSATSAYVSLMGGDSRTFGFNANHFQMFNFQASGQMQFDRNKALTMNLTMQGAKQGRIAQAGLPVSTAAPTNVSTSGNVNFTHLRAFNIPRLRYTLAYAVNDTQFTTRLEGDVNAPRERISQSFEQRFDYNIGRVGMRLSMRLATIEGRQDALIFFRLSREIGGY